MAKGADAHWADWLEARRSREQSLSAECLRANVAQQLFGDHAGVVVAGTRFAVRARIGAGSMGTVYEVERAGCSGVLALKVLHRAGSEQAYRLKREFRTLSAIGHPNLIVLHELFADDAGAAFTMERVRGVDLLAHVGAERATALSRITRSFAQLAEALLALHSAGVTHRDLKPSNVLVQEDGRVVLLDFGVALAGPEHDVSGTQRFMAPEQRRGRTVPASDLFALGVMLELALAQQPGPASRHDRELQRLRALSQELKRDDPRTRPDARSLLRALQAAPRALPVHASLPFVGRRRELSRLVTLATEPSGRPRLVYLEGPSGMGKSALLQELARRVAAESPAALVLSGRCCRRERMRYRALDPLLNALCDELLKVPEAALQALSAHVTGHLLSLFPVLERVAAFALRRPHGAPLADARERRNAAISALSGLLGELSRARPLTLCVDDAHWLDEESSALIRALLAAPSAPPVLWLFAARPDAEGLHRRLAETMPAAAHLSLPALDAGEARALARLLLPDRAELWARAAELSGGNPFMLLQLGHLPQEREGIGAGRALERIVEQRVSQLPAAAQDLLRAVSLSVEPIAPELLGESSGLCGAELESALRLLEVQRYVRPTASLPVRIEPYHDRIAECVTSSTPAATRVRLHRGLAQALEREHAAVQAHALLFHYREAGELAKALYFAELAAEQASARLSFHDAAALLAECVRLAPDEGGRRRFAAARARALVNAGRDREAAEILHELAHGESSLQRRFELSCEAATLFFQSGYAQPAMSVLEPWLRDLAVRPHALRAAELASVLYHRARAGLYRASGARRRAPVTFQLQARTELCLLVARGFARSDLLRAFDYASRALSYAQRGGSDAQLSRALVLDAAVHANISPGGGRSEALLARARQLSEPGDDVVLRARWFAAAAQCAGLRLERNAMAENAAHAVRLLQAHAQGVHMELAEARLMWLIARYSQGTQVSAEVQSLVHEAVQRGDRLSEANARMFLSVARLSHAEPARAHAELDRVVELSAGAPRQASHGLCLANRARIELYEGAAERARGRLATALRAMALHGFLLSPWLRIELRYLLAVATVQAHGARAYPRVAALAAKLGNERLRWARLLGEQLRCWLRAVDGDRAGAAAALATLAVDLEHEGGAWYAAGSRSFAHALEGRQDRQAELLAGLRARGVPEPRSFLTAYGPLGRSVPA